MQVTVFLTNTQSSECGLWGRLSVQIKVTKEELINRSDIEDVLLSQKKTSQARANNKVNIITFTLHFKQGTFFNTNHDI